MTYKTVTRIEIFPDGDWSEAQVEGVRAGHLAAGAISCDKSRASSGTAWKLTTKWPTLNREAVVQQEIA